MKANETYILFMKNSPLFEKDFIEAFNMSDVSVKQLGGGIDKLCFQVHTSKKDYILAFSKKIPSEKKLQMLLELGDFLKEKSFCISRFVKTSSGKPLAYKHRGYFIGVYSYVHGESILWQAYSSKKIKSAVSYLYFFHKSSRSFQDKNSCARILRSVADLKAKIEEFKSPFFKIEKKRACEILSELYDAVAEREDELTVLHGDYGRGNIIFEKEKVTGMIDFESVCLGHPVFDVGHFLGTLLVDTLWQAPDLEENVILEYEKFSKFRISPKTYWQAANYFWLSDFVANFEGKTTPCFENIVNELKKINLVKKYEMGRLFS
ncbi:MAG: hypothetical protein ACD_63C00149G0003 [uncultured bacterium]|nr:MAG: hypothetical protein ACD_63C00149G0003 [uncultured bacterium]